MSSESAHPSPSAPVFRYSITGCGGIIAATHINALKQIPTARIVGMCDIDVTSGKPRADELGAPFFTDYREMLASVKPDISVICTPHPLHAQMTIDSFEAGAHVVVEKPMAIEAAEADRMIEAAERTGKLLAVNFQQRFKPSIERAKQLIDSGAIGPLVRVLVVEPWLRTKAYYKLSHWRGTWKGEGGAVLLNQSPHTLDLLCYLAGLPKTVWGWIRTLYHDIECEDTFQAMLEYPNGAPGYITASTGEAGVQRSIQIIGQNGALELVGDTLTTLRFSPSLAEHLATSSEPFGLPQITTQIETLPGDAGGHYAVHCDMQAALLEGRQPRANGPSGRMSLELANAITLSSFEERAVSLPLDRETYHRLLDDLQAGRRALNRMTS